MKTLIALFSLIAASLNAGVIFYSPDGQIQRVCKTDAELSQYGQPEGTAVIEFAETSTNLIRLIDADWNGLSVSNGVLLSHGIVVPYITKAQAEAIRQLEKPLQLKIYENQYLGICQQLGGTGKLGFDELQAKITALMAQDKDTAVMLTLQLLTLDAAGKREGGLKWWDDIAYHAEIVK